jgi:drug/metabolite transporter (DMT)-like permease
VSFNYTLASVASPIIATSGALIVLLATLFMDERMTWKNAFGIVLIFIGVLGLSRLA